MTRVSRHEPAPDHCRVCGNDVAGDPTRCQVCGTTDPRTVSSRVWRDRADPDAPHFGNGAFGGDLRGLLGDER